jgi:hypothetical protein
MSDRIANWPIIERPDIASMLLPALRACGARCYMMNGARIIVAKEPAGWHLSISRHDRDPTWREIVTARYRLLPNVADLAMHLPRLDEYVNIHPFTFHLHEHIRSSLVLLPS